MARSGPAALLCLCLCMSLCLWAQPVAAGNMGNYELIGPIMVNKTGPVLGLIFVPGAEIRAKEYVQLFRVLQNRHPSPLAVAILDYRLGLPDPATLPKVVDEVMSVFQDHYVNASQTFLGGHSLGAAVVQEYVFHNPGWAGQILLGAGLLRKFSNGTASTTFPVPTAMISGTLDGLWRVTRQAEAFHHYSALANGNTTFPVVVIDGMSHAQFTTGKIPLTVRERDLKPTLTLDAAQDAVINAMINFMVVQLLGPKKDPQAIASLRSLVATTGRLVGSFVDALKLEAFHHFAPACNSDFPMPSCPAYPRFPGKAEGTTPQTGCVCGAPWATVAQQSHGALPNSTLQVAVTDAVHPASGNPEHLPHSWNTCRSPNNCTLNVTTVTEPVYHHFDSLDTGFFPIAAMELRAKLKSREALWTAAGVQYVNFTQTDVAPSLCAEINQRAYDLALSLATPTALKHFRAVGQPLVMGADEFRGNPGFLWIDNELKFEVGRDKANVTVIAPTTHISIDYPIADLSGLHYCKLLSPARALEWILVDGLREHGGIR